MKNLIKNPVYQSIVRNSSRPVCLVDGDGTILDTNDHFSRLTGFSAPELSRVSFSRLVEESPEGFPAGPVSPEGDRGNHFDTLLVSPKAAGRWVEISVLCIEEEKGFYIVFLRDITYKFVAERALEEKNERLDFLTRYASELASLKSGASLSEFVVRKIKKFTGASLAVYSDYDAEMSVLRIAEIKADSTLINAARKLGGQRVFETEIFISPEQHRSILENKIYITSSLEEISFGAIPKGLAGGLSRITGLKHYYALAFEVEGRLLGTVLMGFSGGSFLPDKEHLESFIHLTAVSLRRTGVEQDLLHSRERLRAILDSFTDMIFLVNSEGLIEAANRFSVNFLKRDLSEMIGASFFDISGYSNPDEGRRILRDVFKLREFRTMTHSQGGRDYRGSFFPILDQNHRMKSAVVHIQDITERKELRERLSQAEKMQAVGVLAGGVAHDFNNQLSGILGYTELLATKLVEPDLLRYLGKIHASADNAAVLTRQLLSYAKKGYREAVPVNIHKILRSLNDSELETDQPQVQILYSLEAGKCWVKGDFSLLENVFLNLFLNARDAMPGGGKVVISTENRGSGIEEGDHTGEGDRTELLVITFTDEGTGIPGEILPRIFDPFFTTKREGDGTGMGLASAYGTVESHGGTIAAASSEGEGAVFTIALPAYDESPARPEGAPG